MKLTVAPHDPPAPEAAVSTEKEPDPPPPPTDPEFLAWLEELL